MSILDFFKKGKKQKEESFIIENLNDLEEFKDQEVIYTSYNNSNKYTLFKSEDFIESINMKFENLILFLNTFIISLFL